MLVFALLVAACGETPPAPKPTPAPATAPAGVTAPPAPTSAAPATSPAAPSTSAPSTSAPTAEPPASGEPSSLPSPAPSAAPSPSPATGAILPAGVQYPDPPQAQLWNLPTSSAWLPGTASTATTGATTTGDATTAILPAAVLGTRGRQIRLAISNAGGTWRDVLVDSGSGVRGPGAYRTIDWLAAGSVAAGTRGYLVTGEENISGGLHHLISRLGFAWFSPDGTKWQRTDLRAVLGAEAAFVPRSAVATASGWLMVGSLTNRTLAAKATIVVLASSDGVHWSKRATIASAWALTSTSLDTLGDQLVLAGTAWVCDSGGHMLNAGIGSPQLRLWTSADDGRTWQDRDWTGGGINTTTNPTPASSKSCSGRIGDYTSLATYTGIVNGRAVMIASDHARVATSQDLATWTVADLPGGVPAGGWKGGAAPKAIIAVPDGAGLAIESLEPRRDAADKQAGFGSQVIAWQSPDGTTWQRAAATQLLEVTSAAALIPSPDGAVYLYDATVTQACGVIGCASTTKNAGFRKSIAGPFVPPPPCTPAPEATCAFATIATSLAGADLAGVDLYGAEFAAGADLSGANLSGARLTGATFAAGANLGGANLSKARLDGATVNSGVNLAGADFSGASLAKASIWTEQAAGADFSNANLAGATLSGIDLGGVTLTAANLSGAFVGQSIFSVKLAGAKTSDLFVKVDAAGLPGHDFEAANLAGWYISGSIKQVGNLRGADFRHANVRGVGFSDVDLTGARFPAHAGTLLYISTGVICPDGKKATEINSYTHSCRLPK
jgi:uncharacterized protein YjbI with pentapeptide repeats